MQVALRGQRALRKGNRYVITTPRYSFGQRLENEAQRYREMAETLPLGKEREALLEKARTADLAARMNGWLSSPELKSPK